MTAAIEWKPSELPEFTTVRAKHPWAYGIDAYFIKNEDGSWSEVDADSPTYIPEDRADELLTYVYIESVPKSWYEEFQPIAPNNPYLVNRAGWVMYGGTVAIGQEELHLLNGTVLVSDMVRRAFA